MYKSHTYTNIHVKTSHRQTVEACSQHTNRPEQVDPVTRDVHRSRPYFVLTGYSKTKTASARLVLNTRSGKESVPIQLQQCSFHGLAISNAEINIFLK